VKRAVYIHQAGAKAPSGKEDTDLDSGLSEQDLNRSRRKASERVDKLNQAV
jgi:hypothetical protein